MTVPAAGGGDMDGDGVPLAGTVDHLGRRGRPSLGALDLVEGGELGLGDGEHRAPHRGRRVRDEAGQATVPVTVGDGPFEAVLGADGR